MGDKAQADKYAAYPGKINGVIKYIVGDTNCE